MKLPRIYVNQTRNHRDQQKDANLGFITATSYDNVKTLFPWAKAIASRPSQFIVFPSLADYQLWRRERARTLRLETLKFESPKRKDK